MGIGLGGFVDGILFHQILQLHSMLSNWVPRTTLVNEQINMFWDGLFHAFTWVMTVLGLLLLWRAVKRDDVPLLGQTYVGAVLSGWGIFNLVEGIAAGAPRLPKWRPPAVGHGVSCVRSPAYNSREIDYEQAATSRMIFG